MTARQALCARATGPPRRPVRHGDSRGGRSGPRSRSPADPASDHEPWQDTQKEAREASPSTSPTARTNGAPD